MDKKPLNKGAKNKLHNKSQSSLFDEIAELGQEKKEGVVKLEKRNKLKQQISTELSIKLKDKNYFGTTSKKDIRMVEESIQKILNFSDTDLPRNIQREIKDEMVLEITSLGKIHTLIMDDEVTEIMVNGPKEVWVEKSGQLMLTEIQFSGEQEVRDLADKIATNVGRQVNNSEPIVDARLRDGSRVNIVIPPIAMKGTYITIRKFSKEKLTVDDLLRFGSINKRAARFIEDAVIAQTNLMVSGGTGSGKTTTLNIVSNFVPGHERIITLEDSAELQLYNPHVIGAEGRNSNAEGKGEVTIRDLVKTSLRMRPDRVIVGEVRDGTAFDLLQAMNTGHDGSMATVHANDPAACITRMESLVLQAGVDMPSRAIRMNIGSALHIIVQIQRLSDGSRKITHVTECVGYDDKENRVITKDIFRFRKTGVDENGKIVGELEYTGYIPSERLIEKFEMHSLNYKESLGIENAEEKR